MAVSIRDRFSFKGRIVERVPVQLPKAPHHESRGTQPGQDHVYESPSAWYTSRANEYRTVSVYDSGEDDKTPGDRPSGGDFWGDQDSLEDVDISDTKDPTGTSNPPRPRTLRAGYDAGKSILRVTFRDGAVYDYQNVTPDDWETVSGFSDDESTGRWMNRRFNMNPGGDGIRIS